MDESFLEEQLKRVRALAERMSRAQSSLAEVSEQISRERELMRQHPLYEIRDFRIEQPYDPLDAPRRNLQTGRSSRRRRRQ